MIGSIFDKAVKERAMDLIIGADDLRSFFEAVCRSGFDRFPLKVRNLSVPFHLAGFNQSEVFLAHAETCMVSQFPMDQLETIRLRDMEELQLMVMAWLESEASGGVRGMIDSINVARSMGIDLPVVLRWPDQRTRNGILNDKSSFLGGPSSHWVCAVETTEGQGVVFRYGITRLDRAVHDSKALRMGVKPEVKL